jgi:hypothetical protein
MDVSVHDEVSCKQEMSCWEWSRQAVWWTALVSALEIGHKKGAEFADLALGRTTRHDIVSSLGFTVKDSRFYK